MVPAGCGVPGLKPVWDDKTYQYVPNWHRETVRGQAVPPPPCPMGLPQSVQMLGSQIPQWKSVYLASVAMHAYNPSTQDTEARGLP